MTSDCDPFGPGGVGLSIIVYIWSSVRSYVGRWASLFEDMEGRFEDPVSALMASVSKICPIVGS